jgi:hypothetical protein
LLATSSVADAGGNSTTLVQNTYDGGAPAAAPAGTPNHDPNYGTGALYRGLVTTRVTPGDTVTQQTTTMGYDTTGMVKNSTNGATQVQITPDAATNSVPTALTPNGNTSLQTQVQYNSWLGPTSVTGPNSTPGSPNVASTTYDSAGRVATETSVFGTQTTYTYTAYYSSPSGYSTVLAQTAGVNGPRYTLTTLDGFGRAVRVERGIVSGGSRQPQSYVDTQYAPCGCSPLGNWRVGCLR